MKRPIRWVRWLGAGFVVVALTVPAAAADDAEVQQLRELVKSLQQTVERLNQKVDRLEKAAEAPAAPRAAEPPPVAEAPPVAPPPPVVAAPKTAPPPSKAAMEEAAAVAVERVLSSQGIGSQAPIDPQYRGFFRVPHTKAMIRFNAKPRVDFTYDTGNAGDDNRFVTAKIPVDGDPAQGNGPVFNANGKGSQLIIDVRAPEMDGSPRFYYQNDFYGSGGGEFPYRVQQLWGSIYGVTVGQTFSPFEDPDMWPDTVDYEGPNSMIFARFPLVRYRLGLDDAGDWALNGGLAKPDTQVSDFDGEPVSGANKAPDFAFNLRGDSSLGHVQFGTLFRMLGARSDVFGNDETFGWGLNLSGGLNFTLPWASERGGDTLLAQVTYGEGVGRYGNDAGFFPTDAAFDSDGSLDALPYVGGFVGYTHRWAPDWRSTATWGLVQVDGKASQGPDAFHQTQYFSVNLIWQLRERLSVGLEGLYGQNEKESGAFGDVFRTQVGVAYSLF